MVRLLPRHGFGSHALLVVLVLFALVLTGLDLNNSYQHARNLAKKDLGNLTQVLENQLDADFNAAVRVVGVMASQIEPAALQQSQVSRYRAEVLQWLDVQLETIGIASALRIFDAEGNRLYSTLHNEPPFSIADRRDFARLRQKPAQELVYSEVMLGRVTHRATLYLLRPVLAPHTGAFLGVVAVAIDLTRLQQQFERLDVGEHGVVTLRRLDNAALVVRQPGGLLTGTPGEPDLPGFELIRHSGRYGTVDLVSQADGSTRLYGYRTIGSHPLFVAVGLAEEDYLASWHTHAAQVLLVLLVAALLLVVAAVRIRRSEASKARDAQALRASEERLRSLIDHNGAPILQIDPVSGRIVDANAAASTFYGWSHAELCSLCIQDINQLPPDKVAAERLSAAGQRRNFFIFPHRLASGEIRTVEVHTSSIRTGTQPLLVSIIHDVTERVDASERLDRLMREQQAILDSEAVGFAKITERRIVWANDAFAAMLGYAPQELDGESIELLFGSPQECENFLAAARPVLQDGRTYRVERAQHRRDGRPGWFSVSCSPLAQDEIICALVDISSLHQTRIDLARSLAEQQAMLDTDMVGIARVRGRQLLWVNRGIEHLFGYPAEALVGQATRTLYPSEAAFEAFGRFAYPVLEAQGRYQGQVELQGRDGRRLWLEISGTRLSADTDETFWLLADITARRAQQQRVEFIAYHDTLTGLPNRLLLTERLTQNIALAQRLHTALAVCFLDLDGFKAVNDRHGHEAGDQLLRVVADRLRSMVRASDLVCRMGGDEFVLVLMDGRDTPGCMIVLQRVIEAIARPIELGDGAQGHVTASIGVALHPHHGEQPDALLRSADQAMYQAKQQGRNRIVTATVSAPVAVTTAAIAPAPLPAPAIDPAAAEPA